MKFRQHIVFLTLLASLVLAPPITTSFATCLGPFQTPLQKGSAATALRAIGLNPISLGYEGEYFPKQSAAVSKVARYHGKVEDGRGAEIDLYLDVEYENREPNGLRPAVWHSTDRARLFAVPYTGKSSQRIFLQLEDYGYKTQTTAGQRNAHYVGTVINEVGEKHYLRARVQEKNLEPNGLKTPMWEPAGSAVVSLELVEN